MKVWISTYHGSRMEIAAVEAAGYKVEAGRLHVKEPIYSDDPWEIAKKIHEAAYNNVKVSIGDYHEGEVQIFVSDDWFSQR